MAWRSSSAFPAAVPLPAVQADVTHAPHRGERSSLAWAALCAGILCIGFSAIFVKLAHIPGTSSAFYRTLFAAMPLVPLWLARRPPLPRGKDLRLVLLGGVFFGVDLALWNTSLILAPAATSTLLANNAPLWVGLGALLLFRERVGRWFWVGLAASLAGMSVLVGPQAWLQLRLGLGELLAIAASVFYAAYLLTTQRVRATVDTLSFMSISLLSSVAFLLAVAFAQGAPLAGFAPRSWLALAGLGLVSHLGGWLCINWALGHLRAAPVSVALLGQAPITALLAMPLLGESLSAMQVAGGTMVLGGIWIANRAR